MRGAPAELPTLQLASSLGSSLEVAKWLLWQKFSCACFPRVGLTSKFSRPSPCFAGLACWYLCCWPRAAWTWGRDFFDGGRHPSPRADCATREPPKACAGVAWFLRLASGTCEDPSTCAKSAHLEHA